jgi:hypothetical protein
MATNPPRLDPISATGSEPGPMTSPTCDNIRVTVSVEKSGAFRSGASRTIPYGASLDAKKVALDDVGEEPNPCR